MITRIINMNEGNTRNIVVGALQTHNQNNQIKWEYLMGKLEDLKLQY